MNLFRFTFEDSTQIDRVYISSTPESFAREQFDNEIAKGWVEGANGDYTVEDMGEYIPETEE
tara:strand:+ start:455 stop:640 length:186 start_codon:yes stop_codon:yes gene_type:complete